MLTPALIQLVQDAFWVQLLQEPSSNQMYRMAKEAFPSLARPGEQFQIGLQMDEVGAGLLKAGDTESLKEFFTALRMNDPGMDSNDENSTFYRIGANIIKLTLAIPDALASGQLSVDDYFELYEITKQFDIYVQKRAVHPFLAQNHLSALYKLDNILAFECMYKEFKAHNLPNDSRIFSNIDDLMKPFYAGRYDVHEWVMQAVDDIGKFDRYSLAKATTVFWGNVETMIAHLNAKKDMGLWEKAMDAGFNRFGLERFYPLKQAVESGTAGAVFRQQVDFFLAAKRQGLPLTVDHHRYLFDPIERLAKAIGSNWAYKLDELHRQAIRECFEGVDKVALLKGRRSTMLIDSLHDLMPSEGWAAHATKKGKRAILTHQLDL